MKNINHIVKAITFPITNDLIFYIQIIILLILPSLINAFFINRDSFLTFSDNYPFGFVVRHGASFPYIIFMPCILSYIINTIGLVISNLSKKGYSLYKVIIYSCLFILLSINIFLLLNFKTMLAPTIIMLIAETNFGEATDFFNIYLLNKNSLISYIIILSTILLIILSENKIHAHINKLVEIAILLAFCYVLQRSYEPTISYLKLYKCKSLTEIEMWYLGYHPDTNLFTNVSYSLFTFFISKKELNTAIIKTLRTKVKKKAAISTNIVLIIGESYNKYHSQLYSYSLNTSPHLLDEKKNGNLFIFSDVITPYNMTSFVLRNLFSTNSIMDDESWSNYPAFPYIMKKAGYNIYFWDNQISTENSDVSDYSINSYLHNKDISLKSYTKCNKTAFKYDHELINSFFNSVKLSNTRNLVIFHLRGQHYQAKNRYPHNKQFLRFSSDNIKSTNLTFQQKEVVAHYDNATLYNDYNIYQIIEKFRKKNAIIIYFPDHGEEVYDYRDMYGRTLENVKTHNSIKFQYEIPFIIWCSNVFINQHPQITCNISNAISKPFMIDNICQILFYLAGINCEYYHPERCLISPKYKAYPFRHIQGNIIYETSQNINHK